MSSSSPPGCGGGADSSGDTGGASQTMDQLLIFRALQGLGTGMGIGLVAAVVGDLFPPEQRASKQGLLGIVFGVSQLCGPTLGGWITDHGPLISGIVTETTRWRWLFYLNLPIGLLALLVLAIFLPTHLSARQADVISRRSALLRVDWFGAGLLVTATCSLLLGLSHCGKIPCNMLQRGSCMIV